MRRHLSPVRTALAAVATLALVACGTDADSLPVIRLGAGGAPSVNVAADGMAASSDVARMSMVAWLEYEMGADLPALDGDAAGWRLTSDVDAADIGDLAARLGVEGDVVAQTPEMGGGWTVGANDGSTDTLWASGDGAGWWSYSAAWDDARAGVACPEVLVDPQPADVPAECIAPAPPANVPSAAEAETLFRGLLADLGVDAAELRFEPYADEWGASVYATREIDGMVTPLSWSASYGADAELTYAGGTFAELESIGDVPRIGTDAAFERLTSDDGGWWNVMPLARSTGVAADTAIASSASPSIAVPAEGDASGDKGGGVAIDVAPVEPTEPITVTIVDVEESLWSVWDVDGTVWLVPAYDFLDADGGRHTVPAVPDEMIDASAVTSEGTVDTVVPATDPTGPAGPVDTAVEPTMVAPEFPGGVESLVGVTEADATATIEAAGFSVRVVARDGERFAVTQDYRIDRVNLEVVDGVVTVASIG